jgi:hypothetical protein
MGASCVLVLALVAAAASPSAASLFGGGSKSPEEKLVQWLIEKGGEVRASYSVRLMRTGAARA